MEPAKSLRVYFRNSVSRTRQIWHERVRMRTCRVMTCGSSVCWIDLSRNALRTNRMTLCSVGLLGGCLTKSFCRSLAYDLLKLDQSQNDVRVAETFSQSKKVSTPSRLGLTPGLLLDKPRSCWNLDVQANAERLCEYLRTERPVLLVGSPKCRAFMDVRSRNRRDPKFSKTLEAGLSHLK